MNNTIKYMKSGWNNGTVVGVLMTDNTYIKFNADELERIARVMRKKDDNRKIPRNTT